jgi:hypothetical protein
MRSKAMFDRYFILGLPASLIVIALLLTLKKYILPGGQ